MLRRTSSRVRVAFSLGMGMLVESRPNGRLFPSYLERGRLPFQVAGKDRTRRRRIYKTVDEEISWRGATDDKISRREKRGE